MPVVLSIVIYNILAYLMLPFITAVFLFHSIFDADVREGNMYRLGLKKAQKNEDGRPSIWIHAVSVGEVSAVREIVMRSENETGRLVYLSCTTATGYETAKKLYQGTKVRIFYFPLDYLPLINEALNRIKPEKVIAAEIEIWPNFIFAVNKRRLPLYLINARIGEGEFKGYKRFRPFFEPFLKMYSLVLAGSRRDYDRLIEIGIPKGRLELSGNIKYDVEYKLNDDTAKEVNALLPEGRKIICMGSSHPSEEELLLNALKEMDTEGKPPLCVIAPRDIKRGGEIRRLCEGLGFGAAQRSKGENAKECDVYIVDIIGELLYYYKRAMILVMGGSFLKSVGGHNILEGIYFAKPVICGTMMQNFQEIYDIMKTGGGIVALDRAEELTQRLIELYNDEKGAAVLGERGKKLLDKNKGASDLTFRKIFDFNS